MADDVLNQSKFRRALGGRRGDGCAAHHIVPRRHSYRSAQLARAILFSAGLKTDSELNGVLIGAIAHSGLHTHAEMDRVYASLEQTEDISGILAVLAGFRVEYLRKYPCFR